MNTNGKLKKLKLEFPGSRLQREDQVRERKKEGWVVLE